MQPFTNALQNRCYYKFSDIHKKICVFESLFDKVTGLMACNFIKKRPQDKRFPGSMTCLREAFFMEHLWWLFLKTIEEFIGISKGGLTQINLYDSTNLNM